jgi:cardiolipin synthase
MTSLHSQSPEVISPARLLADQAFSRAAGAPLIPGNSVRLLKDAAENYPAWLEAIESAKRTIPAALRQPCRLAQSGSSQDDLG